MSMWAALVPGHSELYTSGATGSDIDHQSALNHMLDVQSADSKWHRWSSHHRSIGFGVTDRYSVEGHAASASVRGEIRLIVVLDGCITNADRLWSKVNCKGGLEWSDSSADAALIGHLWLTFDTAFLDSLRGPFAFALWDAEQAKVVLCRDQIGQRPLFYHQLAAKGGLVAASSLRGLLASGLVPRRLDHLQVLRYLCMLVCEQPATLLSDVYCLLPGHCLVFDTSSGTLSDLQYWDLAICPDEGMPEEQMLESIGDLFDQALTRLTRQLKPSQVGILLSGGLDSSFLTASLARRFAEPVRTFTVSFGEEGAGKQEHEYAELVAQKLNTEHRTIWFSSGDVREYLPRLIWAQGSPAVNSGYRHMLVGERCREDGNVRLLLGADGADSLFGLNKSLFYCDTIERFLGPPFALLLGPQQQSVFSTLGETVERLQRQVPSRVLMVLGNYFRFKAGVFRWKRSSLTESEALGLSVHRREFGEALGLARDYLRTINSCSRRSVSEAGIYVTFKRFFPNQELLPFQSVAERYGLQTGFPFLDLDLLEFCMRIPASGRRRGHLWKYPIHVLATGLVPEEILRRRKKSFSIPFSQWLRYDLRPVVDRVFSRTIVEDRGLFSHRELGRLYRRFYEEQSVAWVNIWSFIMLEVWMRLFLDADRLVPPSQDLFSLLEC
jgi:asparagine synthase (glutamine-hydrolysing)